MTEQQTHADPAGTQDPGTQHPQYQPGQPGPHPGPYAGPYAPPPSKRLTRTSWDAPISGVCGGLARYLGVDPTLIRVLAVIAAVVTFPAGLVAYVVAWAVMPKELS